MIKRQGIVVYLYNIRYSLNFDDIYNHVMTELRVSSRQ